MSAVGGGGNYISDGQIMAWLANQQDRIYGDLRDSMDLSEKRAQFADDLNTIKAHLQEANGSKDHDFSKVDQELQSFMETYGSDPDFAKTCEDLQGLADRIHGDTQAQRDYGRAYGQYQKDKASYDEHANAGTTAQDLGAALQGDAIKHAPKEPEKPQPIIYSDGDMKSWDTLISGKLDGSSKNDQLTMIHIQELKATLDQGSQLGSTFISSGDKTSSAIINNIA